MNTSTLLIAGVIGGSALSRLVQELAEGTAQRGRLDGLPISIVGGACLGGVLLGMLWLQWRQGARQRHQRVLKLLERAAAVVDCSDGAKGSLPAERAEMARRLAVAFGLPREQQELVYLAALLMDIGRQLVPRSVLRKQGELSSEERAMLQEHPAAGARILQGIDLPQEVRDWILCHQERWDGGGYPQGLEGKQIPIGSRVLALAEAWAVWSKEREDREEAPTLLQRLEEEKGRRFDPQLVDILVAGLQSGRWRIAGNGRQEAALWDEIREAQAEEEARMRLTERLASAESLEELINLSLPEVQQVVPQASVALFILDEESGQIKVGFANGEHEAQIRKMALKYGEGMTGWAIANGYPVLTSQPELDFPGCAESEAVPYSSVAVYPIRQLEDRHPTWGALSFYLRQGAVLDARSRWRLNDVARRIERRVRDLTEGWRTAETALSDPMTGLPTLRFLYAHAVHEFAKARRHSYPVCVVEMEFENYPSLCREHGKQTAERVLRELTIALRAQLRDSDAIARLSETEFAAVLSMTNRAQATFLMRRLKGVAELFRYEVRPGVVLQIRTSFGCAVFPDHGQTPESIFLRANRDRETERQQRKRPRAETTVAPATNVVPFRGSR